MPQSIDIMSSNKTLSKLYCCKNFTVTTDDETMQAIMDGSSSPQAAFMTGKLKVAGDMSMALKIQSVIS